MLHATNPGLRSLPITRHDAVPPSVWQYVQNPDIARDYDRYHAEVRLFGFDTAVLDRVLTRPGALLDLGCGTGRHVVHFARRGFDVTGLDLSRHMLDITGRKLREEGMTAELLHQDMGKLDDLPARSFDYVICMFSTLGLVRGRANRLAMLQEVRRLLKPGGIFVFHVHNRWFNLFVPEGRRWLLHTHFVGPWRGYELGDKIMRNYQYLPEMFLHIFSLGEVRRLVRLAGLRIRELVCVNAPRDGQLRGRWLRGIRSNGFVVVVETAHLNSDAYES